MIWHSTGERILAMQWLEHEAFGRELKKLKKKYPGVGDGLEKIKRLLAVQFDPNDPKEVIAPAKIHRLHQNAIWEMWKVEVLVAGLKPNQWPRVWFVVSGSTVTFLTLGSHTQNYDDNAMDRIALERISDYY